MRRLAALISILVLLPAMIAAQTGGRFNIAVLDLQMAGGVPEGNRVTFSDRLRLELDHTGRFSVIERNTMEDILGEQSFQLSDCSTDECAVEVGRLLGVERMIAGSIGKVGQTYSIILRMIDVGSGRVLIQRNVDCKCPIDEVLSSSIRQAARMIAGLDAETVLLPRAGVARRGDIYIKSDPEGASIYIDGELQEGVTPKLLESLPAGIYTIRLERHNLTGSSSVFVSPGEMVHLEVKLERGKSSLKLISEPLEAVVFLDEQEIGRTPYTIVEIAAGRHQVRFSLPGYLDHEETIQLKVGEEKRFAARLVKPATLEITSSPDSAEVFIDGKLRGKVPLKLEGLAPGKYKITARFPGHSREWVKRIRLREGERLSLAATPPAAWLVSDSRTAGKLEPGSTGTARKAFSPLLQSAIIPGLGNLSANQPRGLLYMIGFGVSVAAAFYSRYEFDDYSSKYEYHIAEVMDSRISYSERFDHYVNASHEYDSMKNMSNLNRAAIGTAAGIYLWSLFDAGVLAKRSGSGETGRESETGLELGLRGMADGAAPALTVGLRW